MCLSNIVTARSVSVNSDRNNRMFPLAHRKKKDKFPKARSQENRQEEKFGEKWKKWPPTWRRHGETPPSSARTSDRRASVIVKKS